jgi:ADP-ribosyl-[dinitrogen reductase] hydrolase
LGCAVGDAAGLPYEGLSKRRANCLLGEPDRYRFLIRRGMVSDDTEHSCMVAESLCDYPDDPDQFAESLACRMRWWLLRLPAGIGRATLRATIKLWLGVSAKRSGVFSAGNGAAMRSAVLGAAIDNLHSLQRFVYASTINTHSDPKAYHGALAVAVAAWCAKRQMHAIDSFVQQFRSLPDYRRSDKLDSLILRATASVARGESTEAFAAEIGCVKGVSGYIYHTVPVAIHCWLAHPHDFEQAIQTIIRCGGDADTTAAIVGAIVGSGIGDSDIPRYWLDGLWEWPQSVAWMKRLARTTREALNSGQPTRPPNRRAIAILCRNAAFLLIVLVHALRRLLPPY